MSALPPKADIVQHGGNVRFVPKADIAKLPELLRMTGVTKAIAQFIAANIAKAAGAVAEVKGSKTSGCDKDGGGTRPGFGP